MNTVFTVKNSTPSNKGTTHVWTLDASVDVTVFGIKKTVKRTFYIGGMSAAAAIGTKLEEDMNRFEVTERPCYQRKTGVNPDGSDIYENINWDGAQSAKDMQIEPDAYDRKLMLKWLHVKAH